MGSFWWKPIAFIKVDSYLCRELTSKCNPDFTYSAISRCISEESRKSIKKKSWINEIAFFVWCFLRPVEIAFYWGIEELLHESEIKCLLTAITITMAFFLSLCHQTASFGEAQSCTANIYFILAGIFNLTFRSVTLPQHILIPGHQIQMLLCHNPRCLTQMHKVPLVRCTRPSLKSLCAMYKVFLPQTFLIRG